MTDATCEICGCTDVKVLTAQQGNRSHQNMHDEADECVAALLSRLKAAEAKAALYREYWEANRSLGACSEWDRLCAAERAILEFRAAQAAERKP